MWSVPSESLIVRLNVRTSNGSGNLPFAPAHILEANFGFKVTPNDVRCDTIIYYCFGTD